MADEINPNVTDTGDGGQVSDGGTGDQAKLGWRSELPDTLKQHEAFASYQTKKDLWQGHIDLVEKLKDVEGKAANTIPKLPENATDEQRAAYYAALGRPETPDKYELAKPDLPEGMPYDPAMESWYRGTAHALGLNQEQAGKLFAAYNELSKQAYTVQQEATAKAYTDGVEALKKEWGAGYTENVEVMRRAVEQFGGADFKAFMDSSGIGNNPVIIKTFVAIGKAMQEDKGLAAARPHAPEAKPGMNYNMPDFGP